MSFKGQILQDRYRISHEIGEGGMGRVYYAEDMRLNQEVAIKETLAPKNESSKLIAARVKAFQREAQLLAGKIKHHAIPRVIDYFQFGEHWYIVMDYVDGDSLETQLQKRGEPFPLDEVLLWMDQLLGILGSLHSGAPQVIHRDIKPSNIKVKNGRVYLLDFGLAKQMTGSKTSIPLFTLSFAPPEQMQNQEPTVQSDIYSVGATMYCLLTGTEPADAFSRSLAIAGGEPDPLIHVKEHREDLPDEVADLIMSGLSIKPEHRPQDAEAMRSRLNNFLAGKADARQRAAHDFSEHVKTLPYELRARQVSSEAENVEINAEEANAASADKPQRTPSSKTLVGSLPPRFNAQVEPNPPEHHPRTEKRSWRRAVVGLAIVVVISIVGLAGYRYKNRPTPPPPIPPRQIAIEKNAQAMEMLYNNDYEKAKALSKEALDKDPSYALAHAVYGDAFWDTDQSEIGVGESSGNAHTQISKGAILKIFDTQEPATAEDFAARGWAYIADKKWDKAQQDVEKAVAKKPDWAWALMQKAFVEIGRGCITEKDAKERLDAIDTLQKANSVRPKYAMAYMNLASAYVCNKQNAKALAAYEQAINLSPSPKFYLARGSFYLDSIEEKTKKQNIENARKDFTTALEKDPNFGIAHLGLARTHEIKGEYKECITEADQAIAKKSSFDAYVSRAGCRTALAGKEKDEKGFEEALENLGKARGELIKYSNSVDEQNARARYFYMKAIVHYQKAYYYLTEKFLKKRNSANKGQVSAELENARSSMEQAVTINQHKDSNKEYEKQKKDIEQSIRLFKKV